MFIIIAQQTGQSPKVKTPPPVPLKPPIRAPKPQTVSKSRIPSPSQSVERSPSATAPTHSQTLSERIHKQPPPPKAPKPQKAKTLPKQPEKSSSATTPTPSRTLSEAADIQTAATPQPKRLDLSSEQSHDPTKTKSLPAKIDGNQLHAGIILLLISN